MPQPDLSRRTVLGVLGGGAAATVLVGCGDDGDDGDGRARFSPPCRSGVASERDSLRATAEGRAWGTKPPTPSSCPFSDP